MYCHKCGSSNQSAKAYCKSCGEWLPDLNAKTRNTFGGETPQQIVFTNLFMSALSTVAALFSAFALYITYLGSGDAKWSIYIAGAFCVCIAGWQASSFFATLRLRQRLKHSRDGLASPSELREMKSAPALNPGDRSAFVGVTSVTENSTELLEQVRRPNRDTQR
jgi:hypothetical protein